MRALARLAILSAAVAASFSGVATGVASASSDYDGLVPTLNYNYVCRSVGGDFNSPEAVLCQTDNKDVYWYADQSDPGELEQNDFDSVESVLAAQYGNPTDLVIHYDSTPVWSGSGQTDFIYQEAEPGLTIPSGTLGVTWCDAASSPLADDYRCDQTWMRIGTPNNSGDGYRIFGGSVACHETGHAVGLVHGSEASMNASPYGPVGTNDITRLGCMVSEDDFPANTSATAREQINQRY